MVLAFFDCSGLIYTNVFPNGKTVNVEYIISALRIFFRSFFQKRPEKDVAEMIFHWHNTPVHIDRMLLII